MAQLDRSDNEAMGLSTQNERKELERAIEHDRDEAQAWSQLSSRSFACDWDSDDDAIYDESFTPFPP